MKNHKLFSLFSQLTTIEKRDLEKYLASPLFNNRKLALQLFQFLQKHKTFPDKKSIFDQLFPNEAYQDEKVRLCMSQLVKKIETFLVHQHHQTKKIDCAKTLTLIYAQKKMPKAAEQVLQQAWQQQIKQPFRNGQYYLEKYELALMKFDYGISIRTTKQNLQEVADSLDTAFIILKLQQACSAHSQQAVYQQDYQTGLLQLILPYIEQKELANIPAIGIYYYSFLALSGQSPEANFAHFKHLLFEHISLFPQTEWSSLFLIGTNICIKIINSGNLVYLKEILELYKAGLSSKALLKNDILTRFTYQNIATSGIRTGELIWTRQFLVDYKEYVEKTYRESAFRFNMARLAYHEKDYEVAIDLLRDTDQEDLLINLYAKNLLLKIYYEIGEFKLLDSFLDAFQIYLRRKKDIASHKKNYWNMIYYTQKLMKVNPFNGAAKTKLQERIEAEEVLLERKWLLEQLKKI